MSTGFLTDAAAGRKLRKCAFVASVSGAISMPCVQIASVAIMPGPPELVTMATRLPRGTGQLANTLALAKRFSRLVSRITPHWRKSASAAWSVPASEPVCDEAALAPAADRPAFNAKTGFLRVKREAIRRKLLGFWMDSM